MSTNFFSYAVAGCRSLLLASLLCLPATAWSADPVDPKAAELKPIAVAELKRTTPVDFGKEVQPLLEKSCTACHNKGVDEGGLILETPASIVKGGRRGPAVVPGKSADSLLLKLASHRQKPVMPPLKNDVEAPNLSSAELGVIQLWIDQGATGTGKATSEAVRWQPLPPGVQPIFAAAVSPDGQYVACGRANQVFIYHLPTGQLVTRLTDPSLVQDGVYHRPGVADLDLIQSLAFHPSGELLASGGFRTAKLWRRPKNVKLLDLAAANGPIPVVATSADGRWLATATPEHSIKLWQLPSGQPGPQLQGHTAVVTGLKFTADHSKLVSVSRDGSLRVWTVADGKPAGRIDAGGPLNAVTLVGDGTQVATGGDDKLVRLWTLPAQANSPLAGIEQPLTVLQPGSESKLVWLGSSDGKARLYDLSTQQVQKTIGGPGGAIRGLSLGNNGKWLAVLTADDQTVRVHDLETNQVRAIVRGTAAVPVSSVALQPAATQLVTGLADGQVLVWKLSGQPIADAAALPTPGEGQAAAGDQAELDKPAEKLPQRAIAIRYNKDGGTILALAADGQFKAYSASDARTRYSGQHGGAATDLAVSADGQLFATGGEDQQVKVWKVENGNSGLKANFEACGAPVSSVRFTADNTRVLAGTTTGQVWVLNLADGSVAQVVTGAAQPILGLATTGAKGDEIVLAQAEKHLQVSPLNLLKVLAKHTQPVTALANVPGAKQPQVASGSADGTLKIWDTTSGNVVREYNHQAPITSIDVRADGTKFVSAGGNVARLWSNQNTNQVAELKGDYRLQNQVALLTRNVAKTKAELAAATAAVAAAEKDLPVKTEAATKVAEALATATKSHQEKATAAEQAKAAKAAADQVANETSTAVTKAKEAVAAAADGDPKKEAQKLLATAEKTAAEATEKVKAAVKAVEEADKAVMPLQVEKQKQEQLHADAQLNLKKATEAIPAAKQQVEALTARQGQLDGELAAATKASTEAEKPIRAVAFSPDGLRIATVGDSQGVHLWEGETGKPNEICTGHAGAGLSLAFVPAIAADGAPALPASLVTVSADGHAIQWNLFPDWTLERTIGNPADPATFIHRVLALAFSKDGTLLATGGGEPSRSGELKVFNVSDGSLVRELPDAHSDTVFGVDFAWDGQQLASCAADKFVKVHKLSDGQLVKSFEGHTHHVLGVGWHSGGKLLASGGADNVIKVWNLETGEQARTIQGIQKQVTSLRMVGESDQVVTASGDKNVRFHNITNGQASRTFGGGTDFMNAADATPDATLVIGGGQDGVLRVWNGTNGNVIRTFDVPK